MNVGGRNYFFMTDRMFFSSGNGLGDAASPREMIGCTRVILNDRPPRVKVGICHAQWGINIGDLMPRW